MKNIISEFTKEEIEKIRKSANFTDRELELYELRSRDISLEECAEIMNLSVRTVGRLSTKVYAKIHKLSFF